MDKEKTTGKSLLTAGAAAAACGAALYAVGQTLRFLFRDVDPERTEQAKASEENDDDIDIT